MLFPIPDCLHKFHHSHSIWRCAFSKWTWLVIWWWWCRYSVLCRWTVTVPRSVAGALRDPTLQHMSSLVPPPPTAAAISVRLAAAKNYTPSARLVYVGESPKVTRGMSWSSTTSVTNPLQNQGPDPFNLQSRRRAQSLSSPLFSWCQWSKSPDPTVRRKLSPTSIWTRGPSNSEL